MSFGTTRHLCHYKVLDFGRLADVRKLCFWGVGYKTHHDIRSRRRNSWKSLTGTMSLYYSMAFSDLAP